MDHHFLMSPMSDREPTTISFSLAWGLTLLCILSASQLVLLAMFAAFGLFAYAHGMLSMNAVIFAIVPKLVVFVLVPLLVAGVLLFLRNRLLRLDTAEKAKLMKSERIRPIGAVPPALN